MPGSIADDEQRSPARKAAGPTLRIKFEVPLGIQSQMRRSCEETRALPLDNPCNQFNPYNP